MHAADTRGVVHVDAGDQYVIPAIIVQVGDQGWLRSLTGGAQSRGAQRGAVRLGLLKACLNIWFPPRVSIGFRFSRLYAAWRCGSEAGHAAHNRLDSGHSGGIGAANGHTSGTFGAENSAPEGAERRRVGTKLLT